MRFPRYWAKGTATEDLPARNPATHEHAGRFGCWGWSDDSLEEAEALGRRRAEAVLAAVRQGRQPDRYGYGDRPIREEVVEEWTRADGGPFAALTRNVYGCLILNTANAMFVDVDLPEACFRETLKYLWARLLGRRTPSRDEQQIADAKARLEGYLAAAPEASVRIYRTRAGLRYLFTHGRADPTASSTLAVLESLGADPLYIRLCRNQECFRARLTPKPWRCGLRAPRIEYPRSDASAEPAAARAWQKEYAEKSRSYATCELLEEYGSPAPDDEIQRVLEVHDAMSRVGSGLPLA